MVNSKEDFIEEYRSTIHHRSLSLDENTIQRTGDFFFYLSQKNCDFNLTAYRTTQDLVDFHLIDTLELLNGITGHGISKEQKVITDVGTGAGIPGLVIKLLHPDIAINLVESNKKKATFLKSFCEKQGLKKVQIIMNRAEFAAHNPLYRETSDIVVARAIGSFSATLELTSGFAKCGGYLALQRGKDSDPGSHNDSTSARLCCEIEKIIPYQLPRREQEFCLVLIKKKDFLPSKFPRKPGQIRNRPL